MPRSVSGSSLSYRILGERPHAASGPPPPLRRLTDTMFPGTARPARYVVIHDEVIVPRFRERAADVVEQMIHDMCYLYGRATRAVSICPPAYYADIVCARARVHMSDVLEQSETASQATTSTTSTTASFTQPAIHWNIKNDMFYI